MQKSCHIFHPWDQRLARYCGFLDIRILHLICITGQDGEQIVIQPMGKEPCSGFSGSKCSHMITVAPQGAGMSGD